jgi:hypothetical protein
MSQNSNAQTPTKYETATNGSGASNSESQHPETFSGTGSDGKGGPKLGPVSAGHSSKIGKVG